MSFANHPIKIILPFGPPGFSSRVGFALQSHLSEFLETEITFEHITEGLGDLMAQKQQLNVLQMDTHF